ncbi:MAG: threonylcarbamoyl-AMP synthase [Candidatus Saccharimonas sp.]|nr:threonylcarbamoyl-AMP synthase [Planctomycetaceae bacterium]
MSATELSITPQMAASVLKLGGLVALPTETVYGLGANALDARAVARIFAAKERPFFDPLIVHLADVSWWPRVVLDFPPVAERLAKQFWPGPLTLVLPKNAAIPDIVTAGIPSVAIRVPDHPLTREVLRLADVPVAAPSANPFGRLSPTTAEHVRQQLGDRVDLILDGGPCRVGVESTILQLHGDEVVCLRPGGVPLEEIESLIGPVGRFASRDYDDEHPVAPGMLASHYAPRTKLTIVEEVPVSPPSPRTGLLLLQPSDRASGYAQVETLSRNGDLIEAASNFFQALHRLDQTELSVILATPFPDEGLGIALNDRLRRAAH